MEVTRPEETTVQPKEKQMSATQMAHEIMSAGKNYLLLYFSYTNCCFTSLCDRELEAQSVKGIWVY